MEVNGYSQLFGYNINKKNILEFNRTVKNIQVWNNLRVSKWLSFWVKYFFKSSLLQFHAPDSSKVTVIMDYVKVWDSAVALLLAGFVLKLL